MQLTPVKTPKTVKALFPNYIWDIKTNKKEIFLTFDDGPTPKITAWVLEHLKKYNAKASFFCIGSNIEKYPDLFDQIINEGHVVGNHTFNHVKGWRAKTSNYIDDTIKCDSIFKNRNIDSNLFRPPYGKIKPKQAKKLQGLGYKIIMWDVLSLDWDNNIVSEKCLENVINNTIEGSIIVFHDSIKAQKNMKYTLPKVLEYFTKKGFSFKALEV